MLFDYKSMCCDVAASLWALYYERPDAPTLILPSKRDGVLRVSEQESRILITQWLQSHGIYYSIETPTTRCYQQSGQAPLSARIDVTVYASQSAASRAMNLELKAGTSTLEAFRKDFEKLLCEGIPGLWFHTLESASQGAWRAIARHMEEAFTRVASHADSARHAIWFAFCALDAPELVQFEIDFACEWRGQVNGLITEARRHTVRPEYRAIRPDQPASATAVGPSSLGSYGPHQKLLIYAPGIDRTSFLHLSVKGESYALREFPPSGPTRRWVLDDAPTTSQLRAKCQFVYAIDVTRERENLEGEREYWRQRVAAANRLFGLG